MKKIEYILLSILISGCALFLLAILLVTHLGNISLHIAGIGFLMIVFSSCSLPLAGETL